MGVKGLWRILQPVREQVSISSLRGKVLAVDLAIWVVQSETVTNNEFHGIYLRQMFYKINHLLEHGVGIIIVTDGKAPHLKALTIAQRLGVELDRNNKVIQRRRFMKIMKECEILAQSLGITVLKGAFEAEAAAAKLQQDGIVDGVITTDGDAFLYGARQVYRNLLVTEKYCEVYKMSRVETEIGLSRDDLVGMAILNGCDFNPDGVSGLGRGTVLNYILSRDRTRTVTEELVDWGRQAGQIGEKYKQLEGIKRKPHCSICKHQGSKKEHAQSGCTCCTTTSGCAPGNIPCDCTKHVAQRLLNSSHMQCCVKFVKQNNVAVIPVQEIVNEFRNNRANDPVSPGWELPPCFSFINFMAEKLQWRKQVSAEKFCHVAALHHISQNLTFSKPYPLVHNTSLEFNHILKRRRKDKVEMLELEYSVVDEKLKAWLEFDVAYAIMDAQFVEYLLPDEVREFNLRDKQLTRKKKENIPIYDRYPVKKPTPEKEKSKPVTRPKTAGKKSKKGKKIDSLSDSLNGLKISEPLRDITGSISSIASAPLTLSSDSDIISEPRLYRKSEKKTGKHADMSSSEDEYVPLSQRLAMKRAKSAKSASSPDLVVGSTSSLSSLDSKQSSLISDNYLREPRQQTETETDNAVIESESVGQLHDDNTLSGSEMDGYIDSDVQLLPHNFMDEYLDLSRDEILGISREDVSRDENTGHVICDEEAGEERFDNEDSVIVVDEKDEIVLVEKNDICGEISDRQYEKGESLSVDHNGVSRDNTGISRENSSLLNTESIDSEDYRQLVEGGDYHKLFFPTPAVESRTGVEARDTVVDERRESGVTLDIPTMNLSTSFSDLSTGGELGEGAPTENKNHVASDVINISSDADWDTTADISENKENEARSISDVIEKTDNDNDQHQQAHTVKTPGNADFGVTLETSGVIPENDVVTPEDKVVTPDDNFVTLENSRVTLENREVTRENSGIAPENNGVAPENTGAGPENSGVINDATVHISVINQIDPSLGEVSMEGRPVPSFLTESNNLAIEDNFNETRDKTSLIPDPELSHELSLDLSCNLGNDSELQVDNSDINMGFSPKTPAPKHSLLSDLSNLSLSDLPGGFTPQAGNLSLDQTQSIPLPDISSELAQAGNLSLDQTQSIPLPDISSELAQAGNLSLDQTQSIPLPDISSELAGSVISESVQELSSACDTVPDMPEIPKVAKIPVIAETSNNVLSEEISDISDVSRKTINLNKKSDEISANEISSAQSVSFSPSKTDCIVLVPDTPATTARQPPQDGNTTRDRTRDVTRDVTRGVTSDITRDVTSDITRDVSSVIINEVTTPVNHLKITQEESLSADVPVLQPITTQPSLPIQQNLSFDPSNISDLNITPSFSTPNDDNSTLPSPDTLPPELLSRLSLSSPDPLVPGIISPDPVIPGIISQPHHPPDISFLEPRIEVSTPVWHRTPLSDIKVTSTPKQFPEAGESGSFVGSDPLPDIVSGGGRFQQPDFNLNITELLEQST